MFKFFSGIFCKKVSGELGAESEKESKKPSRYDRYFKVRVNKYYGLQGIAWEYRKATVVPRVMLDIYADEWEVVDYCIVDYFLPTTPLYLIKPRNGIEITKEEYEANK